MNWLKSFWHNHVQKTLASLMGALAMVDLTGYTDAVETWVGHKGMALIRLLSAVGIIWRAMQAQKPPAPDPSTSRP